MGKADEVISKIASLKLTMTDLSVYFCEGGIMIKNLILLCTFLLIFSSCAEITPPHPVDILTHPLGKGFLKSGMDKKEVLSKWGEPDEIIKDEADRFGVSSEKWIYRARIEDIPVSVGYLTRTYYLYFEGDALLRFKELK